MIATAFTLSQALEGTMLVCFGVSWPFSILKAVRTRRTEGKSAVFVSRVLAGYLVGLAAKWVRAGWRPGALEPVAAIYAVNAAVVAVDLALFVRYRRRAGGVAA
jgi:fructose-specific phosphotransferase system IIC component